MIFYRLNVIPEDFDPEGEDNDLWFTSLRAAKAKRAELIACAHEKDLVSDAGYEIERVEVSAFPKKELALRLLNRRAFVRSRKEVVAAVRVPRQDSKGAET